jgi:hypothetical protein
LRYVSVFSALLIGAGTAAAATAAATYFTRYSAFDSLYGEIDSTLYLRITTMTSFEKTAVICGVAAVATGLALAVARVVSTRVPPLRRRAGSP